MEPTVAKRNSEAAGPPRVTTDLSVTGMTCGNCVRHVTEALQTVPGVRMVTVSLDGHQASVRWSPGSSADAGALIRAVEEEGYGARVIEADTRDHGQGVLSGWRLNLLTGVPVTLALMLGEWAFGWGLRPWFQWASFALAGVVQTFGGAKFYVGAWGKLRVGESNMDTLVSLGSSTAFFYSVWALLSGHGGHLYFMEAAAIITLISLGHWFESRVSVRASQTLRQLLQLAPELARQVDAAGVETEVPVSALAVGDVIALRPGDRVPTDGRVLEGGSAVDESMLTGESIPAQKNAGDEVYAGTVNASGRLRVRVTATGEETALAHIIQAVQRAQTSRASIQRLGDRVSSIFVPIVVVVAVAAGLWWGLAPAAAAKVHGFFGNWLWPGQVPVGTLAAGFIVAAAVLIIACPCAMGLATPAAIMAGSNAAAKRGILIRDGVALEKAGVVTAVLFDKTGTLTAGRPELAEAASFRPEWTRARMLAVAAGLARHSTHPLSQAVARGVVADSSAEADISSWEEAHGSGVQGTLPLTDGGRPGRARMGSLKWLAQSGVALEPGADFATHWSEQAATVIGLAWESELLGLIALRDAIKPGAPAVVRQLQNQGLRCYLVTGDNPKTAAAVAAQAGIPADHVFAEVRPEKKAEFVERLQRQGERVAFVGDGINDGPALQQADLGIAVSRASDIAREAADIVLLKSEIEAVPESLGLARATLRTIHQNLFWAFFYNSLGVPLAALGFMSPILCAAAMGISDVVVIGNALRLNRWKMRLPTPAQGLGRAPAVPEKILQPLE